MSDESLLNVFDYERAARVKLAPAVWDYIASGADDEITLSRNRQAFERLTIRPRMLVDVRHVDLSTTVLGLPVSMPILIAPTAQHGLLCPQAEIATVEAAAAAGTVMVASTESSRPIEEIAAAAAGSVWFQLYVFADRPRTRAMLQRAEAAGCRAIVVTVDAPRWGRKERHLRSESRLPWPEPGNLRGLPAAGEEYPDGAPATWADVEWIRALTRLPIVLKGILTAEDAALAVARGVDGIVVSNHGGRQLDGVPASIDALPEVCAAVDGRCELYLDSGIRRGTDVLKALALGARAAMVGKPVLWGLAVAGAIGARDVLNLLKNELAWAMALSGTPAIASVERSLVR